jgi:hypothetical protein
MTINGISNLCSTYSIASSSRSNSGSPAAALGSLEDGAPEMSELAKYMKQLQDLQTSDPAKFKTVASQISQKLSDAAAEATQNGDTGLSNILTDMADKFKTASTTGEMPLPGPSHGERPPMGSQDEMTGSTGDERAQSLLHLFQQGAADPFSTLVSALQSVLDSAQTLKS